MTRRKNRSISKNIRNKDESDNIIYSQKNNLKTSDQDKNEDTIKNVDTKKKKNVERIDSPSQNLNPGKRLPTNQLHISSNASFGALKGKVSEETLQAIEDMGFTKMMEIQAKVIPQLLEGRNLVTQAKPGSGKTLSFLIPAIEMVVTSDFKPRHGTGCIIISPTRELTMQTFSVLQELMKYHKNTYGFVMDGADRDTEAKKLQNGINVLVATPRRLLDHLQNTEGFVYKNLKCLIIDEVDRILENGFEIELKEIINLLPEKRLTALFSAKSTRKTGYLTRLAVEAKPVYIGAHEPMDKALVEGTELGYVLCPPEKKFLLLFTFLKKNRNKKIIVFFSSWLSVKFHDMLLNYLEIPVMSIHGKQEHKKKIASLSNFCNAQIGILLCTDVAASDLDIPAVDWMVQYDPPDDLEEYIHRIGRTVGNKEVSGQAILLLRPEELSFLHYLKNNKIQLNKMDFTWNKVADIQLQIEKLMRTNYALNLAANDAFKSCVKSYDSHHLKKVFNIKALDLTKLAKTFGLTVPPRVDLNDDSSGGDRSQKRKGAQIENQPRVKRPYKFIQPNLR